MTMIFTTEQLITWLKRNVKDRVLQNALAEENIVLLGGFNPLPGGHTAGWIVKLGQQYVCIVATKPPRWYRTKEIPWKNYVGRESDNPLVKGEILHPQQDGNNAVSTQDKAMGKSRMVADNSTR